MLELIVEQCDSRTAKGIAHTVSSLIRQERLGDGDRLPSVRSLAQALNVSPSTITAAWALLTRAGLIWTDGRRGTRIHIPLTEPKRSKRMQHPSVRYAVDLSTRLPDPELLPDLKQAVSHLAEPPPLSSYFDVPVLPDLAQRLRERWGNPVETIALADAAVDALDLITQTFLQLGEWVAVEEVTDPQLIDILDAANVRLRPVELDARGPNPQSLRSALEKGVRVVFLQPRCHVPLGMSLGQDRRDALIEELRNYPEVIVVEIDLSTELASAPPVTFAEAFPQRVLQVRAFSGAYGPELRIAGIGGSTELAGELIRKRHLGQGWTSRILQAILLEFLSNPEHQRSVERARLEYARRRELLVQELRRHGIEASADDGLMVWIPAVDETSTMIGLAARGISVTPGSAYAISGADRAHICLSVTHLKIPQIPDIAQAIAQLVR